MKARIIIGCDGSPEGDDALRLGHVLATALDAVPVVATVVRQARRGTDEGEFERAVEEFCRPLFARAGERLEGLDMEVTSVIHDSRARAIYDLADWYKPSLIVIGSTKRGPAGRIVLGSLGNSLLSGAPCSVAVAPRGYVERRGLERIGAAVDGGSESRLAITAAGVIAGKTGKPLELLSVMEPPHYALGGLLSDLDKEEYHAYRERETEGILDKATESVPAGVRCECTLLHGHPAEALAEAAENLDLLILGSRGYGPAKGALLGSVSAKLIESASCPVMVVPRGVGPEPLSAIEMQAAGSADPG